MVNWTFPNAQYRPPSQVDTRGLDRLANVLREQQQQQREGEAAAQAAQYRQQRDQIGDQRADRQYDLQTRRLDHDMKPKPVEQPWWVGPNGQIHPAMLAKITAGRAQNNVTVNGSSQVQETAFDKEMGKSYANLFSEGMKGSMKARKDLNDMNVLQDALADPNLYQGAGGETVQALKKTAQTLFSLPVAGVGAGELVDVLSKKAALALKDDLPGPMSNSDREYLNSLPPSLTKSPEGNRLIASLGILQQQYTIARQQAAVDYAKGPGRGRVDIGFNDYLEKVEGQYREKAAGLMVKLRGLGEAQPKSPTVGIPLDMLRKQYGLE